MPYSSYLSEPAEQELLESFLWYKKEQKRLVEEFLEYVQQGISLIEQNPLQYEQKYLHLRVKPLKRFPYNIIYLMEGNEIRIIAIFHMHRDPTIWQGRS